MTDIEDRLRDAFTALDDHVVVPPRRTVRRNPWRASLLAVGAAAAALVLIVTMWSLIRAEGPGSTTVAGDVSSAQFDLLASRLCRETLAATAGTSPQVATADAYRVAALSRIDTIDAARRSLALLPDASDGARVRERAGNLLDQARATAAIVVDHADNGYVQTAGNAWRGVDRYIDAAFRILADHGAEDCA